MSEYSVEKTSDGGYQVVSEFGSVQFTSTSKDAADSEALRLNYTNRPTPPPTPPPDYSNTGGSTRGFPDDSTTPPHLPSQGQKRELGPLGKLGCILALVAGAILSIMVIAYIVGWAIATFAK